MELGRFGGSYGWGGIDRMLGYGIGGEEGEVFVGLWGLELNF